jgi:CRP-like cAMP-binding protein
MENRRLSSTPLPSELELLGEGESFQDTICSMLKRAKGFEFFKQPDLVFLAKHMKAYRVQGGTTIFREGDSNSYLCVLIEGRVCVYKEDRNNEIKLLTVIPQGRIFGEISVIDNLPYSASLIAESDAIIVLMSRESFRQCIDDSSIIGVRLLGLIARLLCARLRSASGQLVDYIDV